MFGKSRRIRVLEAALERQRVAAERWQADWRKRSEELADAKLRLARYELSKVHTDANGQQFIYVTGTVAK